MRSMKGFTLLELLIAFSLSMMLFITLTQLILGSKMHYEKQQQLMDIQEAAQAATIIFHEAFREAQASTVNSCKPILWLNHRSKAGFTFLRKGNQWAVIQNASHKAQLIIQHWKSPLISLSRPMSTLRSLSIEEADCGIKIHTPVVITDCQLAEIATVVNVRHKNSQCIILLKEPLSHAYDGSPLKTWVAPLRQETYYVGVTPRHNGVGQPIRALYVKDILNDVYELVPGIESMRIDPVGKGNLRLRLIIGSLTPLKSAHFFASNKKTPLWMAQGRLHLLWDIVLRKKYG